MADDEEETPSYITTAVEIVLAGPQRIRCQRCAELEKLGGNTYQLRRDCYLCNGIGLYTDPAYAKAKELLDNYKRIHVDSRGSMVGAPLPTSTEEKKRWNTET
jgi:hypothetical protein